MAESGPREIEQALRRRVADERRGGLLQVPVDLQRIKRDNPQASRELWTELLRATRVAPGRESGLASKLASTAGLDAYSILNNASAPGNYLRVTAEACWLTIVGALGGLAPRAASGSKGLVDIQDDLEKLYAELVRAYKKAVDEVPYTIAKGDAFEALCAKIRRRVEAASHELTRPELDSLRPWLEQIEEWRASFREEMCWYGQPSEKKIQDDVDGLYRAPGMKACMDSLPPRGWYDLAVMNAQARDMVARSGTGGLWRNALSKEVLGRNIRNDPLALCKDRANYFIDKQTRVDPFTGRRSNLPAKGDDGSGDWKAVDFEVRHDSGIPLWGETRLFNRAHTAALLTWVGRKRGGGTLTLEFIVDTWNARKYLLCPKSEWSKDYHD
jgi:hypothetical protein